MKKKLLTFTVLLLSLFLITTKTFAQAAPGDDGSGGIAPDPGGTGAVIPPPPLVIDLGGAGAITIVSTSAYYTCVTSILNFFHIPIVNGVVTFPTITCYNGSLSALYFTRVINYNTWHTACNNPPPSCHR